jgi:hypothetical protein
MRSANYVDSHYAVFSSLFLPQNILISALISNTLCVFSLFIMRDNLPK